MKPKQHANLPIVLELPFPPTVNTYWRHVVIGKRRTTLLSAQGRRYRTLVEKAARYAGFLPNAATAILVRLRVVLLFAPPDARKRDLDNLPKGVLDGLTHAGVWADDEQIDELVLRRGPIARPEGRVTVVIEQA